MACRRSTSCWIKLYICSAEGKTKTFAENFFCEMEQLGYHRIEVYYYEASVSTPRLWGDGLYHKEGVHEDLLRLGGIAEVPGVEKMAERCNPRRGGRAVWPADDRDRLIWSPCAIPGASLNVFAPPTPAASSLSQPEGVEQCCRKECEGLPQGEPRVHPPFVPPPSALAYSERRR